MFDDSSHGKNEHESNQLSLDKSNSMAFSPEVLSDALGQVQYNSKDGFNDIALLAALAPSEVQAEDIVNENTVVDEFIASAENSDEDSEEVADSNDEAVEVAASDGEESGGEE